MTLEITKSFIGDKEKNRYEDKIHCLVGLACYRYAL